MIAELRKETTFILYKKTQNIDMWYPDDSGYAAGWFTEEWNFL